MQLLVLLVNTVGAGSLEHVLVTLDRPPQQRPWNAVNVSLFSEGSDGARVFRHDAHRPAPSPIKWQSILRLSWST